MAKVASRYLQVHPWAVVEKGFHPSKGRVSESIFSLGNEYMGVRGYLEEGYGGDRLVGSYFNGVWAERHGTQVPTFRGMVTRQRFMVNSVDWLHTRITVDGETLDLAASKVTRFVRRLDLSAGTLTRELVWQTTEGKRLKLTFVRFLSMVRPNLGCQRITLTPLNFSGAVRLLAGLDFSPMHEMWGRNFWTCPRTGRQGAIAGILGRTVGSGQQVFSSLRLGGAAGRCRPVRGEKFIGLALALRLRQGVAASVDRMVVNYVERHPKADAAATWARGMDLARRHRGLSFDDALAEHQAWWQRTWAASDVAVEGDDETQQGVRFCIFQMHQTYHGVDARLNVAAKGLTGENYGGHTFWDTETYCLPFYIFSNPKAARHLLGYRHRTLRHALARARELDCTGARYPMSTIDGTESCDCWQHGDLQIHVSAGVAYGIRHYVQVCNDKEFLYRQGMEVLCQVCRFFASRGQWSRTTGEFGFWGVMGPDEFHMMVHNNCYTNVMAKKAFEYTLACLTRMRRDAPDLLAKLKRKVALQPAETKSWRQMAAKMRMSRDEKTGVFEQFDGFFRLPHIDVKAIPPEQFPLYKHWAYIRIFRYDMIKQPDVLLLMLFFAREHSLETKRANYAYYEPRCIHESSLSPGVHAILAAELGLHADAADYSLYAARLDLDNYNRNTHEGLHTTSMAAAWMNVVYGFGGLRSDGAMLAFNPSIPSRWKSFAFRVRYRGAVIAVEVDKEAVSLRTVAGAAVRVEVFGTPRRVGARGVSIPLPPDRRG